MSRDNKPAPPGDDEILTLRERRVSVFRVGQAWRSRTRDIGEWMANGGTPENGDGGTDG